jgi:dienelactone hydrolase
MLSSRSARLRGWNRVYPDCTAGAWVSNYHAVAPLLILAGELDDRTPSGPCQRLADRIREQGQPVSIKIYPGALHSFDSYALIMGCPKRAKGKVRPSAEIPRPSDIRPSMPPSPTDRHATRVEWRAWRESNPRPSA